TPLRSCAPKAALPPVRGPATPNLICADAEPAARRPEATAAANAIRLIMLFSRGRPRRRCADGRYPNEFKRETRQKSLGLMRFPTGRDAVPRARLIRARLPIDCAESRTAA